MRRTAVFRSGWCNGLLHTIYGNDSHVVVFHQDHPGKLGRYDVVGDQLIWDRELTDEEALAYPELLARAKSLGRA